MKKFNELPYERPDIVAIKAEFSAQVEALKNADSLQDQKRAIEAINKINNEVDTASNIASIRNSIDTRDSFYDAEKAFFDEYSPEIGDLNFDYYTALANSKFKEELKKEFGNQLFTIAEYRVNSFSKEIIEDLKEENKLASEYSRLVASAKIEFDGKECNLSQLSPYAESKDREVRKAATEAKWSFVAENEEKFDEIYDKAVKLRHGMATKMGLKNFVELGYLRMQRSDYTPEMVAGYRQQILEHVVPLCSKIRKKQANRLGLEKLKHYDVPYFFNTGNPKPKGSSSWIIENGIKMYQELSTETGKFFDFMTKYELMDLETKKGKDVGGYCTFIANYGAPFIFSNFNGTSGDIDVLTHEAGHAFQVYSSKNQKINEYFWPTYESAEIHSMSMEFFTWPWMGLFFKEDTEKYKYQHLASGLLFLPYGVAVDEFQHEVYERPEMTPAERKATWKKIQNKYLPDMDFDGLEILEKGGRWQLQSHIYQSPFYYIDYTLAQVCAFQFWTKMQENFKEAWADYLSLCQAGGSLSFLQLVQLARLKSPFEKGTLEGVVANIESWLDKIDDTAF
ncbi:MAG: M3 family oligoendopeptidase [Chitinophagales bacterium]|nr:M3 family oligoendopeptidase [Chitinophagales bacterium]